MNGDQTSTAASSAGAVWVFGATANGSWTQQAYVKPNNTDELDEFGSAIALSNNGNYPAHSGREDVLPRSFGVSVDINGMGDVTAVGTTQFAHQTAGVFTFTDP